MVTVLGRKIVAVFILITAIILGELYVMTLRSDIKAIVFRAHFILFIQVGLVILSTFVWRNFRTLFQSDFSAHAHSQRLLEANDNIFKNNSLSKFDVDSDFKSSGINGTILHERWHFWKKVLFCYLFICHLSYFTNIVFIGREPFLIAVVCYVALGSLFQLVVGMCFVKLIGFFTKYIFKRHIRLPSKYKLSLAVVYSLLASSYGLYNASVPPTIKTVSIPVKGLPNNLEGLTIVQLSDVHLGPTVGQHKMQKIVEVANQIHPGLNLYQLIYFLFHLKIRKNYIYIYILFFI